MERALKEFGSKSREELLGQIAGDMVRIHRAIESNVRLQNQLSQWVKSCYCVEGGAKCLLCETRDILCDEASTKE